MNKKLLILAAFPLALLIFLTSCGGDDGIKYYELPESSVVFVSDYYPTARIDFSEKTYNDDDEPIYKVDLSNNTHLIFDQNGDILQIDATEDPSLIPPFLLETEFNQVYDILDTEYDNTNVKYLNLIQSHGYRLILDTERNVLFGTQQEYLASSMDSINPASPIVELPTAAVSTITDCYKDQYTVSKAFYNSDNNYEATLGNGVYFLFDEDGTWQRVISENAIEGLGAPHSLLPSRAQEYIAETYLSSTIVDGGTVINMDRYNIDGYTVELANDTISNGDILNFDSDGKFIN